MVVAAVRMTLHLPENGDLKGKRSVVRSLTARLRNEFNAAVAEIGALDLWQTAEIGIVVVSNSHPQASERLDKAIDFVERQRLNFEVGAYETESFDIF
jgi:uncharacterized protein